MRLGDNLTQMFGLRLVAACLEVRADSADAERVQIAELLVGRTGGGADPVMAAAERILALVDRECTRSSVVLVLDDLQWADEASLAVWAQLFDAVQQSPLLLIGVSRPVPQRPELATLRESVLTSGRITRVDLVHLTRAEVERIAADLLAAAVGPRLRGALGNAAGNPLYLRELVDVLAGHDLVRVVGGIAELSGPLELGLTSLSDVIGRRLDFLSGPSRSALRGAAWRS